MAAGLSSVLVTCLTRSPSERPHPDSNQADVAVVSSDIGPDSRLVFYLEALLRDAVPARRSCSPLRHDVAGFGDLFSNE